MSELQRKYLSEYQPSPFLIDQVFLTVRLTSSLTQVISELLVKANHRQPSHRLTLVGEDVKLVSLMVNGQLLSEADYQLTSETLSFELSGSEALVIIETEINPQANSRLEGLYLSDGVFCTQCEAEGFRRISYYLDRPDVMALFTTRIEAEKAMAPVLLSNGNLIESGLLDSDRHYAVWHDPFPKPSYLFALVAGDLVCRKQSFVTAENRMVSLEIYVKAHHADRCDHALASLANAMRWDEKVFGLSYDLDRYMIVAVDDFNMGAMENKGLNVFNARFVLADPQTATDTDYVNIDSVIAHEYFHNWTGNRVTCRDWFQLTLKEGLTVYRDQLYTEQTLLGKVKRIEDVRDLRSVQFAEDAGPLRHPIQPNSYVEMNNFYTATVYEKGAEVVRIYESLLGATGFRKGMDLYFSRHDGQAVRVEDFRQAMADANGVDLSQMQAWYTQAGTPELNIEVEWQSDCHRLTIRVIQSLPNNADFNPFLIPFSMSLFNESGVRQSALLVQGQGQWNDSDGMIWLTQQVETLVFEQVNTKPRLSLLRNFSAPVVVKLSRTLDDWLWQARYDDDLFNRWEAWQQVWMSIILTNEQSLRSGGASQFPDALLPMVRQLISDPSLPLDWLSEALKLPGFDYLAQQQSVVSPHSLLDAIDQLKSWLASSLQESLRNRLADCLANIDQFEFNASVMANRAWCHLLLSYLAKIGDRETFAWATKQVLKSTNMTNSMAALVFLVHNRAEDTEQALEVFYDRWQSVSLVLDKWFAVQANNPSANIAQIAQLCAHESFVRTNPNRVRSVLGNFSRANPRLFHQADGAGYRFMTAQIKEIDEINPQIAARLVQAFSQWKRLSEPLRQLAGEALGGLATQGPLSKDVQEVLDNMGYLSDHNQCGKVSIA